MAGEVSFRRGTGKDSLPFVHEPAHATRVGDPDREPLGIFLGNTATDEIEKVLSANPDSPVAGLLIGVPCEGPRRPFLLVTGIVLIDDPLSEDGIPNFTEGVAQRAQEAVAAAGNGAAVAGWFSAQPRKGVEISPFERYVHRKHVPERWHVALLIDSSARASRLYRWEGERLVACDNFYVWNAATEPFPSLAAAKSQAATEIVLVDEFYRADPLLGADAARPRTRNRRLALWIWVAACLVVIYLLIPQAPGSVFWLQARQARQANDLSRLEQELARLELEANELTSLRETPGAQATSAVGGAEQEASASQAGALPQSAAQAGPTATLVTSESAAGPPSIGSGDDLSTGTYVIQPGDTMWAISTNLFGDPLRFRTLAEENQIEDPNLIFPGQRLRLPTLSIPEEQQDPDVGAEE